MIDVAAAILVKENKVLIAKRKLEKSQGGYWEFPGGKVENGEAPSESLLSKRIKRRDGNSNRCERTHN